MIASGIYCITNKINNKKYIGQSNSVFTRWGEHANIAFNNDSERKSLIHKAIKKYGLESFTFEILELCELEKLNDLEIFYIKSFKEKGFTLYNLTNGGDIGAIMYGENNPNSILTDEEVYDIRERYNNKELKRNVYKLYKDKMTYNGFHCIWCGTTRKTIHMDVYTEENKYFHRREHISQKDLFQNSNFTEEDVRKIRDLRQSGYCPLEAYEQYKWINKNTFNDIWYMRTFPHIKSNLEKKKTKYIRNFNQSGTNNKMAKFTKEQIIDIRKRKENGEKIKEVYKLYSFVCMQSFRRVWNNQTYKNIHLL